MKELNSILEIDKILLILKKYLKTPEAFNFIDNLKPYNNIEICNDELKLALNSKFLRDAISVFDDKLKIQITKDNLKLVVTSASNPNNIQLFTGQKGF